MASTNEQIKRIETDILKVQTKIKAYQEKLSQLTEKRKQLQERALLEKKIMLISSANTVGHENRNKKLSSNRLNTVKQFLLSQGVSDTQFKTEVSLGDYGMTTSSDCRRVIVITQP